MFSAVNIDRGNMSAANSDGILKDLHLTTADYVSETVKRGQ